jgi:hypothetical protein
VAFLLFFTERAWPARGLAAIKRSLNACSMGPQSGDKVDEDGCCSKGWPEMTARSGEALEVLRELWRSQGQGVSDLDGPDASQKSCKKMADVGFDDFAPGDADLGAAWRAKLEREGKLADSVGSVRDLVLGPDQAQR